MEQVGRSDIEQSEFSLGPDAPIFQWVKRHDKADEFDRNGGSVPLIKDEHAHERTTQNLPEITVMTDHSPVPTPEEIWASVPYEASDDETGLVNGETLAPEVITEELSIDTTKEKFAWNGLKRVIPRLNRFRNAANSLGEKKNQLINRRKAVLGAGAAAISGAVKTPGVIISQVRDRSRLYTGKGMEFIGNHQRKIYIGAGAIAILGLATAAVGSEMTGMYGLVHFSSGHQDHLHDAAKQMHQAQHEAATQTTHHIQHAKAAAQHSHKAVHQAANHSQAISYHAKPEVYNFNAAPGDSITREIQNVGSEHGKHFSPQKAYDIYLNLKQKLHGHIAHRQISLANGDIGLPLGQNSLSKEAISLINQYSR